MSLLKTKPRYAPNCVATESGWTNPLTGEVLVAIGMLKTKLALENPTVVEKIVIKEENIMNDHQETPKPVVKEATKKTPKKGQVLLGEVVEMPVVEGAEVIGENNLG